MRRCILQLRSRRAGFTLVELVLVMLVIAIVVAIVAPSFRGSARGRRTGDTARQVISLSHYARTQAVSLGKTYRLNFDLDAGTYWLTTRLYDAFENPGTEFGRTFSIADGVRMECDIQPQQDGLYVEFNPTGRTDPATIRLIDDQDGSMTIVACESATELFHILDDGR